MESAKREGAQIALSLVGYKLSGRPFRMAKVARTGAPGGQQQLLDRSCARPSGEVRALHTLHALVTAVAWTPEYGDMCFVSLPCVTLSVHRGMQVAEHACSLFAWPWRLRMPGLLQRPGGDLRAQA